MDNPLISVIIPVYNPGSYLNRCLDSVVNQTYRNLQIILIDDGSTDGSGQVCDEYAARDSRIVCVHKENGGVSKARNTGIELAKGDYFSFPDSDDYLETDTYEYLIGLLEEHKCDAVNFEHFITYKTGEKAHEMDDSFYGMFSGESAHRVLMSGQPFSWAKIYSRRIVEGLQFREDIMRGEDGLFAHMAVERAESVWFDKRPLYHYVQSEESACRGKFRPSQLTAIKLYDAYKPLYKEKYPKLWSRFLGNIPILYITLYYDMWSDERDYSAEEKKLRSVYNAHYKEAVKSNKMSAKKRIKLWMFRYMPNLFCRLHKMVHWL